MNAFNQYALAIVKNDVELGKNKMEHVQENELSGCRMGSFEEILLKTFENIPREQNMKAFEANSDKEIPKAFTKIKKKEAVEKSREEAAIQDMRRVLYFMEKKLKGEMSESDKEEIKKSTERWKESMEVLRQNILK